METVWETNNINSFKSVSTPLQFDVVVVGGGLTALLTAYFLKDSNLKVGVICDKNFTQSASARSNAKITTVNTTLYSEIAQYYGNDKAKFFYRDKHDAMFSYKKIIHDHHIECDFEKSSSFVYSTTHKGSIELEDEFDFFKLENIPFITHTERLENLIEIRNAYEFEDEYKFNPVKFMESIITITDAYENVTFFDNSPVTKITNKYLIANGHKILFNKCVCATHYPPFKFLGQFPLKMSQEKATLATFKTTNSIKNMYVGLEENTISYRSLNDDTVILVANNHRTGTNSEKVIDLYEHATKHFSNITDFKTYTNQDCVTNDGLPYVDTACFVLPNVYIATGYNLFGITCSMLASKHISRAIVHGTKLPKLYSRNRFNYSAQKDAFKNHMKIIFYEFLHRTNKNDGLNHKSIRELQNGQGFTFKYKRKNIGVSRQNDKLYFVLNNCPHLHCPLHYNEKTQTWDCRCHGSSYKPNGEFIYSPTNKNLKRFDYADFKLKSDYKE